MQPKWLHQPPQQPVWSLLVHQANENHLRFSVLKLPLNFVTFDQLFSASICKYVIQVVIG